MLRPAAPLEIDTNKVRNHVERFSSKWANHTHIKNLKTAFAFHRRKGMPFKNKKILECDFSNIYLCKSYCGLCDLFFMFTILKNVIHWTHVFFKEESSIPISYPMKSSTDYSQIEIAFSTESCAQKKCAKQFNQNVLGREYYCFDTDFYSFVLVKYLNFFNTLEFYWKKHKQPIKHFDKWRLFFNYYQVFFFLNQSCGLEIVYSSVDWTNLVSLD